MLACVIAPLAFVVFGMLGSGGIARATGLGYAKGSFAAGDSSSSRSDDDGGSGGSLKEEEGATALADFNVAMAIWLGFTLVASFVWPALTSRRFSHHLRVFVLFDNCTSFILQVPPLVFWALVVPGYTCHHGRLPFDYDLMVVCSGALAFELVTWVLLLEVKGWSVAEEGAGGGQRPKEVSILRAQQMAFVNCPLHGVAFWSGSKSAYRILFDAHDASLSWGSFGHRSGPGDWAQVWLLFLAVFFTSCIGSAGLQIAILGLTDPVRLSAFGIGIVICACLLSLIADPFSILVFGRTVTVTLKHAYFVFWSVMLSVGVLVFVIIPQ
jgi:hypothetical protein